MSPEHLCEVLAQNTQQIMFYSLLKLPLLGYANELLLPEKRAELQELSTSISSRDGQYLLFFFRYDTDIFKPSIIDIDTSKLKWPLKLLKEYNQ